jgi:hypothetical protein
MQAIWRISERRYFGAASVRNLPRDLAHVLLSTQCAIGGNRLLHYRDQDIGRRVLVKDMGLGENNLSGFPDLDAGCIPHRPNLAGSRCNTTDR